MVELEVLISPLDMVDGDKAVIELMGLGWRELFDFGNRCEAMICRPDTSVHILIDVFLFNHWDVVCVSSIATMHALLFGES